VAALVRTDGRAEISVSDDGPGISDAEKGKVVERFYRGDSSRGTPGVGLGLSLAQAVAKLHGSTLELSDRNPGLRVALTVALDTVSADTLAAAPAQALSANAVVAPSMAST
jgi:signal transduction histidine kinase